MTVPPSFVQELLARVDIVEVVGRHVRLKKGGANWMGLCPFHSEKSPSFSVSPAKQFFHCFGCGKSGDAITFLMEHQGMPFRDAVQELAMQHGMTVPQDNAGTTDTLAARERVRRRLTLTQVLEQACAAYQQALKTSQTAVAYLRQRGLDGAIAKRYGIGYASGGWQFLASVFPHYDDPLLAESGLVIDHAEEGAQSRRYDRFRDRIMFPIRNVKGECIGFGGRVLGADKPKYLNSPETPVFSKGRELYGLFEGRGGIREAGYALVTEGYMDVVALAQMGFANAVATLGTACTPEHVGKLFRFTDAVVFSFDGDAAGRNAARKALDAVLPLATDVRSIKFLFLPPEHDPDSFIRAHGAQAFGHAVQEALPLSRFLLDVAQEGCDLHVSEGRSRTAHRVRPLWELLPAGGLRHQVLGEIASLVQVGRQELMDIWQEQQSADAWHSRAAPASTPAMRRSPQSLRPLPRRRVFASQGGRLRPPSRADRAVRILLDDLGAMEGLTAEDLALLCALPDPHGALLRWLEGQFHEHGAQTWVALRAGLAGHPAEQWAVQRMADASAQEPADIDETRNELRTLLYRMHIDQLMVLETRAIEESRDNPEALHRYRELQNRRKWLQAQAGAATED
ncbi:DNA primase [Candidatus Symbiobacter mobilis]|uniref:DNA primase n=1 Tax=Candidatus Symbiobacter mobilis CR TaxID=946483 RepID=U5NAV4_9BURK|nr:DNA primase [Candidatus Symbiobacter mobilis]AGX88430.1 DNA primase [Candidatus Symbiobacter mobilis CR]